ncbi:MAG: amidohydrolase, partial [Pseudomonadota bacterium]
MLHEAALKPFLETSGEFIALRRDLHRHPELAFEEQRTSDIVAAKLEQLGIPAHRGLAGTGVVGTLKAGTGNRAIGLRADMDALPMAEANDFDYRSTHANKMHACGHDGHTAMLLAAAAELSARPDFDGTVYFIFQPAEENEGGAKVMIEDGLFDQFDMEAVYGMHNMPQLPLGTFVAQPGSLMAGFDIFNITVEGKGGHAAMPHLSNDPIP